MAVPKQKTSKSRRDKRRSHLALTVNHAIETCTQCSEPKLMHRMCPNCGYYRGNLVMAKGA